MRKSWINSVCLNITQNKRGKLWNNYHSILVCWYSIHSQLYVVFLPTSISYREEKMRWGHPHCWICNFLLYLMVQKSKMSPIRNKKVGYRCFKDNEYKIFLWLPLDRRQHCQVSFLLHEPLFKYKHNEKIILCSFLQISNGSFRKCCCGYEYFLKFGFQDLNNWVTNLYIK